MIAEDQFPHDCSVCVDSPQLRAQWGCDGSYCGYDVECPSCDGKPGNTSCTTCKGQGSFPQVGCPKQQISPDCILAIELYNHYRNHFLPEDGGILDQQQKTFQAINFVAAEFNSIEEEQQEQTNYIPPP